MLFSDALRIYQNFERVAPVTQLIAYNPYGLDIDRVVIRQQFTLRNEIGDGASVTRSALACHRCGEALAPVPDEIPDEFFRMYQDDVRPKKKAKGNQK